MSIRLFISSLLWMMFSVSISSQAQDVIRLTNGEWKPYQSEELPNYGPYSEIAKLAFAEEGIKVEFGFFPWNRAVKLVEEGRWDGTFFWVSTAERRQKFLLTNPVITLHEVIYYHKDRPLNINSLSDFSRLTLGRIQSSAFGGQFEGLINTGELSVSVVPTNDNLFKMLYSGRVDFVPELINSGYDAIDSLPDEFDKSKFGHLEDFQYGWVSHMMISKNIENGPYFVRAFNRGFRKLQEKGVVDEILAPALKPKRHQ